MHRITAPALLGAGALLFIGLPGPANAAELTAPVYHVTQEGLNADQGAKLADAFGIPNSLRRRRRVLVHERCLRAGPAAGRRQGQGRVRPPDPLAGARHPGAGRAQAAVGERRTRPRRQARRHRRLSPRPHRPADGLPHRAHAVRPRRHADQRDAARHQRVVPVRARRSPGQRPGREAARRVRRRRQRDPALDTLRKLEVTADAADLSPSDEAAPSAPPLRAGSPPGHADARLRAPAARRGAGHLPVVHLQPDRRTRARRPTARSRPSRAPRRTRPSRRRRDGDSIAASVDAQGGTRAVHVPAGRPRRRRSTTTAAPRSRTRATRARQATPARAVTLEVTDANGITVDRIGGARRATAASRSPRTPAAAASASSPSARPTSASSRPSTSGSARRTARSASRT